MKIVDYLIRAESRDAWLAFAQEQGWIVEGETADNVQIDEIGPVVLEPGDETTPPVMDEWYHVNLRLLDPPGDVDAKLAEGRLVTTDPMGIDAMETGVEPERVQVLDHADIATPIRIWAGGMHFPEADDGL